MKTVLLWLIIYYLDFAEVADVLSTGNRACLDSLISSTYTGVVSETNHGHTCLAWTDVYGNEALAEHKNYCRDFDDPGRPWCAINNLTIAWEYCTFAICLGTNDKCETTIPNDNQQRTGTITVPDEDGDGYHDLYIDCYWFIGAGNGEVIKYRVEYLDRKCAPNDILMIQDFYFPCQSGKGLDGETKTNGLFLRFYSDTTSRSASFYFNYTRKLAPSKDCMTELHETIGKIDSPDYDSDGLYDFNIKCLWIVEAAINHYITFQIVSLDIEYSEGCTKDLLDIHDDVGRMFAGCGLYEVMPEPMKTVSNILYVYFVTDGISSGSGFSLTYEVKSNSRSDDRDCLDNLLAIRYNGTTSVTNNGHTCQSWSNQTPHKHEYTSNDLFPFDGSVTEASNYCRDFEGTKGRPWCFTTNPDIRFGYCTFVICPGISGPCGGLVESRNGSISASGSTLNVTDVTNGVNKDCLWTLQAPEGHVFLYELVYIHTEDIYDCGPLNSLTIVGLFERGSPADVKNLCEYRNTYTSGESKSNVIYIRFYFDKNLLETEFKITFRHIPAPNHHCSKTHGDQVGWITAPDKNGDGLYDFNLNCTWTISALPERRIVLQPVFIDIFKTVVQGGRICVGDYLKIMDGYGPLTVNCGQYNVTEAVLSRTSEMHIVFVSNNIAAATGFNLTYETKEHTLGCMDSLQTGLYHGKVRVTNHGRTCQAWSSDYPHRHFRLTDDDFPADGSVADASNYCRNFKQDGERHNRPGCFTTDHMIEYDWCFLSICHGRTEDVIEITTLNGMLSSPDMDGDGFYDDNLDILWRITVQKSSTIRFEIHHLHIELSYNCERDALSIFDKMSLKSALDSLSNTFCGANSGAINGESDSNTAFVAFHSDGLVHYTGFRLSFRNTKAQRKNFEVFVSDPVGSIVAPDLDNDGQYDHNLKCTWNVVYGEEYVVSFQLLYMRVEYTEGCRNDFLMVFDGFEKLYYCGNGIREVQETAANILTAVFTTNNFISDEGFELTYRQVQRPLHCWRRLLMHPYSGIVSITNNGHICQAWSTHVPHAHSEDRDSLFPADGSVYEAENYCRDIWKDGKPWCYTTDPEIRWGYCNFAICPAYKNQTCGGVLEMDSGVLSHPDLNYDRRYDLAIDCLWKIQAKPDSVIRYRIQFIDIEYSKECSKDVLWIFENGFKESLKFCGNYQLNEGERESYKMVSFLPNEGQTTANKLFVQFYSDHDGNSGKGFEIRFYQRRDISVSCHEILRNTSGYVTSPDNDLDGFYDFNLNCSWFIVVPEGKTIVLTLIYLAIEWSEDCQSDHLTISELVPSKYSEAKLHRVRLCGEKEQEINFRTLSNTVDIDFVTNNIWTGPGFSLKYDTQEAKVCVELFYENSGYFIAPDNDLDGLYDDSQHCGWGIYAQDGNRIEVDIFYVKLEYDNDCSHDILWVQAEEFCGEHGRQARVQYGDFVEVMFVSNHNINDVGFFIAFEQVRDTPFLAKYLKAELYPKWLTSPDLNGDGLYDYNTFITYLIEVDFGMATHIQLLYLAIETSLGCLNDRLMITALNRYSAFCGTAFRQSMTTTDNVALFFRTDNSVNDFGFKLSYTQLDKVIEECVKNLTGPSGYITAPDHIFTFIICYWLVTLKDDHVAILIIQEIHITCEGSSLEIFEIENDQFKSTGAYCGMDPPPSLTTETNHMAVEYHPFPFSLQEETFRIFYIEVPDETNCSSVYRCLLSDITIGRHYLCDDYRDCPHGDDERYCNFRCPQECECFALKIDCTTGRTCSKSAPSKMSNYSVTLSPSTRSLDIGGNHEMFLKIKASSHNLPSLIFLNLSSCEIVQLPSNFFVSMVNLKVLDLSYNKLKNLASEMFSFQANLEHLYFIGNKGPLVIDANAFHGLLSLKHLHLDGLLIQLISKYAFAAMNLKELRIMKSIIENVELHFLGELQAELIYFNTSKIQIFFKEMFDGVSGVQRLVTDEYKFCCVRPMSVFEENCFPRQDEFSTCDDMIGNEFLRPVIWTLGMFCLLTNGGAILYRLYYRKEHLKQTYGIIVAHLSVSDILMSLYLLCIAAADAFYRGVYIFFDEYWRQSVWCKTAGILSTVSFETSLLLVGLITVDRFLVVKYPFGQMRLTKRMGSLLALFIWILFLGIAVLPEAFKALFNDEFYSQSALCLPLPITRARFRGYGYAFGIYIVLNSIVCLLIAVGQWATYREIKTSSKALAGCRSQSSSNEARIAMNLLSVAVTNVLASLPVFITGILAAADMEIPVETYAWIAVVVLPINGAINPVLYTIVSFLSNRRKRQKASQETEGVRKRTLLTDGIMDNCYRFLRNPAFRKHPENTDTYVALRSILTLSWFDPKHRLKVAARLAKQLCLIHDQVLLQDKLTADDILIQKSLQRAIDVVMVCRLRKAKKQDAYADNIHSYGKIISELITEV